MAEIILKAWGRGSWVPISDPMTPLINQKGAVLHNAWLSQIGHQRPGMAAGLPMEEARARAVEIDRQLEPLIEDARKQVIGR